MTDISKNIKNGTRVIKGLKWDNDKKTYYLIDNITWTDITVDEYILLQDGETFDGNSYEIKIDDLKSTYGIFASNGSSLNNGPIIKKLSVSGNVSTSGLYGGGGIMRLGQKSFTIENCSFTGIISASCGGISGSNTGMGGECLIYRCFTSGSIGDHAGGIVGSCSTSTNICICTIYECYSTGSISPTHGYGGGICGSYAGGGPFGGSYIIYNCYSTGSIGPFGGGICGANTGEFGTCTIYNCYSVGDITSGGGICGYYNDSASSGIVNINSCYSLGNISGQSGITGGGIVGQCHQSNYTITVSDCYSIGTVNQYANGICGDLNATGTTITITRCYSSGMVYSGSNSIGTKTSLGTLTISNCYGVQFNGTTIYSLDNISEKRGVLINSVWDHGNSKKYPYPKLKAFKYPPWKSSKYEIYIDKAQLD